jgi:ABC-type uncharacterized transport system auxiliary subunit
VKWRVLSSAVVFAGCSLLSKAPPRELRYFTPEKVESAPAAPSNKIQLRLGRVRPAELLRTRILHRQSPVEVQEYDMLRWTEPPDAYVRRALARALFDGAGFVQVVGGLVPTLDVDVVAFEQDGAGGRVQLHYLLTDDRQVLASGDVVAERPATGTSIEAAVAAIGAAMNAASAEVASRIATALHAT